jgi:hypothetical protein
MLESLMKSATTQCHSAARISSTTLSWAGYLLCTVPVGYWEGGALMDSMYSGYSIQAQGAVGTGGPSGRQESGGVAGGADTGGGSGGGIPVVDEGSQPNADNKTVVSPGVVIVNPDNDNAEGTAAR